MIDERWEQLREFVLCFQEAVAAERHLLPDQARYLDGQDSVCQLVLDNMRDLDKMFHDP